MVLVIPEKNARKRAAVAGHARGKADLPVR
jgi:hypothetical protein